jgi:mRNA-degrading endonuclease RelE of RelBE toxin-antitoxin system
MKKYEIYLNPSAVKDMDSLRKYDASEIADRMERHLVHEPDKESKSRIKRLKGIQDPDYRLRVGEYRGFYNIEKAEKRVVILRVMHKDQTYEYYKELEK